MTQVGTTCICNFLTGFYLFNLYATKDVMFSCKRFFSNFYVSNSPKILLNQWQYNMDTFSRIYLIWDRFQGPRWQIAILLHFDIYSILSIFRHLSQQGQILRVNNCLLKSDFEIHTFNCVDQTNFTDILHKSSLSLINIM